ncbi:MAG: ABC transporter ATP-binding protein [Bacilli bacterium]|jgi:ABC-2 type transport system ATP-binding protein|nr:ABC transporter ATP-binding protein [Bacilli bacterium]MDY0064241.1 ABC transporter ATP-binding protein [Bacilli bacterium]
MKALLIEHVKKYYGTSRGVEDVTFDVNFGEIVGFVGPNGAGKSTILRLIMGLLNKDTGQILIENQEPDFISNKNIGYLPSEVFLFPEYTVLEQLQFFASIRKVTIQRGLELAGLLQLDLSKKISQLSFGNRKKVGIVAALLHQPKIILLDEPTSGLDPLIQQIFFTILQEEKAKQVAILLSSHVLNEVEKICDRIVLIKEGRILFSEEIMKIKTKAFKKVYISPVIENIVLPGLIQIAKNTHQVIYTYQGEINALLQLLASYSLESVNILDLDLEEIFMQYYQGDETND